MNEHQLNEIKWVAQTNLNETKYLISDATIKLTTPLSLNNTLSVFLLILAAIMILFLIDIGDTLTDMQTTLTTMQTTLTKLDNSVECTDLTNKRQHQQPLVLKKKA